MYVWQLHTSAPSVEKATLFLHETTPDHWQVFIAWHQTANLESSRPKNFLRDQMHVFATDCGTQQDTKQMVVSLLLSMLSLVCTDTLAFRDQCLHRIGELVSIMVVLSDLYGQRG